MTRWFPIAPGTTLPAAPAAIAGQLTVTKTVPVWNETVLISAKVSTNIIVEPYDYDLSPLTGPVELTALTLLGIEKITAVTPEVATIDIVAASPLVSVGAVVTTDSTSTALSLNIPSVATGASVLPSLVSTDFVALAPEYAGAYRLLIDVPTATSSIASLTPAVSIGAAINAPAIDVALAAAVPTQAGSQSDPYFSSVSLLLHGDGTNGSTTFTDSSSNAFTITAYGNAQISTTNPKYGTGCILLDGSGDYLTAPADNAFVLGTGDFTVECWCYPDVLGNNDGLFKFGNATTGPGLCLFNSMWYLIFDTSLEVAAGNAVSGAWQHIALTRSGTSWRLFVDGTQLGSTVTRSVVNYTTNQLLVGYYSSATRVFQGKIDEFRVTKGVARYTADFTAPTAAFPNK